VSVILSFALKQMNEVHSSLHYCVKHGPAHLVEAKRVADACHAACSLPFVELRLTLPGVGGGHALLDEYGILTDNIEVSYLLLRECFYLVVCFLYSVFSSSIVCGMFIESF
jgi:hypothetical protein